MPGDGAEERVGVPLERAGGREQGEDYDRKDTERHSDGSRTVAIPASMVALLDGDNGETDDQRPCRPHTEKSEQRNGGEGGERALEHCEEVDPP